jgi:hypothetical protein
MEENTRTVSNVQGTLVLSLTAPSFMPGDSFIERCDFVPEFGCYSPNPLGFHPIAPVFLRDALFVRALSGLAAEKSKKRIYAIWPFFSKNS